MKGIYVLLIKVNKELRIKIGALGTMNFNKGYYAYVGSSQNNLMKRLQRHYSSNKRMHWHIDYLLKNENAVIKGFHCREACKEWECMTARELNKKGVGMPGFGCSDCKCKSHLIKVKSEKLIKEVCEEII